MQSMINIALVFSLFFFECIFPRTVAHKRKNDVIMLTSIPKCGSHLAEKCISMLTRRKRVVPMHVKTGGEKFLMGKDVVEIQQRIKKITSNSFASGHISYASELDILATQKKYKIIFIYRDPRAQVVSLARWWMPFNNIDNDLSLSISSLISDNRLYNLKWDDIHNVNELYNAYIPWIDSPNTLAISFEELVGGKGGGSAKVQRETVTKIANFLDLKISDKRIDHVCANLFGDTVTFYKGQIDGWRDCFTDEHKKTFKKCAGDLLIRLGYENGLDW